MDGEAAFTCGSFAISSANSARSSLRVNHSLGGCDSEAQGNRYAIIVSDPRSRIPPSTESLSPLITELTAITFVIPMTIPRIVSDERSRFFRSVSSASATSSLSFSECSIRTNARKREARESARVLAIVDILRFRKNLLFRAQSFYRVQSRSFRRRICAKEKSNAQRHQQSSQHRPELHRSG